MQNLRNQYTQKVKSPYISREVNILGDKFARRVIAHIVLRAQQCGLSCFSHFVIVIAAWGGGPC